MEIERQISWIERRIRLIEVKLIEEKWRAVTFRTNNASLADVDD